MQRNFIVENDLTWEGIPVELRDILETRFTENRVFRYGLSDDMKKDPEKITQFLSDIKDGDSMIGQTNFHDEDQVEKIVFILIMLMKTGKHIHMYISLQEEVYGTLEDVLWTYYIRPTAFKTPSGFNELAYKEGINGDIHKILLYHEVWRIRSSNSTDDQRLTIRGVLDKAKRIPQ